jgi:DNA-binding transcriptional MerR regulator/methylmalonyl-CoA mutase cobalamin-binding subunit
LNNAWTNGLDGNPMTESFVEARHPIGVVSERTGLSPEVLRVWERRYAVVRPTRSEGGQRLYTDSDVDRLRLLKRATEGGRSIGSVARLPAVELSRIVREDEEARARRPDGAAARATLTTELDAALAHTRGMDADALEALLERAFVLGGASHFLGDVAAPLMRRIGDEWHAGRLTPAQEHLATAVVKRVVQRMLSTLRASDDAPAFLVATPTDERHEIGALLAAATAAAEGWRVIYLGPSLPAQEIAAAAKATRARAVGVSVVLAESRRTLAAELSALREALPPSVPLLVGGAGARDVAVESEAGETLRLKDLEELRAALRRWSAAEE